MRVAEHDDVGRGVPGKRELRGGLPELVAVAHVNRHPTDRERPFARQHGIVRIVNVAVHRVDRRDLRQRRQDARAANVARVKNVIDAVERRRDPRSHESVRIGNNADDDHRCSRL